MGGAICGIMGGVMGVATYPGGDVGGAIITMWAELPHVVPLSKYINHTVHMGWSYRWSHGWGHMVGNT